MFESKFMSRVHLMFCPECEAKAVITKTARIHKMMAYKYCSCSNSECGLTFRVREEFDKMLSPSSFGVERLKTAVKQMNDLKFLEPN